MLLQIAIFHSFFMAHIPLYLSLLDPFLHFVFVGFSIISLHSVSPLSSRM